MGFGAEMKDFVSAFQATSSVGQKISDRRAKNELTRGPTQAELDAMSGPGSSRATIPQVSGGQTASVPNRGGGAFAQQAYDYYRQKGLTSPHAMGISANLQQESGGDPRVIAGVRSGDAGKSFYAAQWQGKRLNNLLSFAGERGRDKPNLQDQLDFVLEEGGAGARGMKSPFIDQGAVQAYQLAGQAQSPEQAVAAYRTHFERPSADDLNSRVAHLGLIKDSGNYDNHGVVDTAEIPAPQPQDQAGAIPDTSGGGGGDVPADGSSSPGTGIDVVPVDVSQDQQMQVPQVMAWTEQQPAVYAAHGGAIPEPHYAPGGPVDPYNRARDFTQAIPAPAGGFVPRRVGQVNPNAIPAGPTPSQLAFRNIKPVVDPPVKPVVDPKQVAGPRYMVVPRGATNGAIRSGNANGTGGGSSSMALSAPFSFTDPSKMDPKMRAFLQQYPSAYTMTDAQGQPVHARTLFAEGGAIPEPHYAPGGPVRESWHAGAGRIGTGETLVDPGSRSNYNAADDKDYWQPAKPSKAQPSAATSSTGKGKSKPAPAAAATPARATDPRVAEMTDRQPVAPAAPGAPPAAVPTLAGAAAAGEAAGAMVGRPHMGPPIPLPERNPMAAENQTLPAPPVPQAAAAPVPAIPDMIDQRIVSPAAAAEAPPAPRPDHAAALKAAWDAIAAGQNPKQVGQGLIDQGIDMSLWPAKMQNIYLGFKEGGAVPEPHYAPGGPVRESWHAGASVPNATLVDPGTATDTGAGGERTYASVQPTKKLRDHVAIALDGGVKFLTGHFGLQGQGAIAAPGDQQQTQAGAQRFARGEGQTTPEELKGIDDSIDPQRQLSEGDRQMTRLAKTMDWYSQRGQKKQAQAAAASLMQYGATRFSRLGSLAAAAYQEYQQTGDPKHLQHTVDFLQNAYEMIPDGAKIDVSIDSGTKKLMATRTDAEGHAQKFEVQPDEIPQMIQGVQDKSSYWQSVFSLADPAGARQQAGWQHSDRVKQEDRAYRAGENASRDAARVQADNARADRIDARAAARDAAREKSTLAREQRTSARKDVNWEVVNPLQVAADAAKAKLDDTPESQKALDEAASQLWDALPPAANRAQFMKDMGFDKSEWSYTKPEVAPEAGARKAPDGSWYKPDPARPGKWVKLEPAS